MSAGADWLRSWIELSFLGRWCLAATGVGCIVHSGALLALECGGLFNCVACFPMSSCLFVWGWHAVPRYTRTISFAQVSFHALFNYFIQSDFTIKTFSFRFSLPWSLRATSCVAVVPACLHVDGWSMMLHYYSLVVTLACESSHTHDRSFHFRVFHFSSCIRSLHGSCVCCAYAFLLQRIHSEFPLHVSFSLRLAVKFLMSPTQVRESCLHLAAFPCVFIFTCTRHTSFIFPFCMLELHARVALACRSLGTFRCPATMSQYVHLC